MNEEHRHLDLVGPDDGRAVTTQPGISNTVKVAAEQTGGAYSLFGLAVEPGGGEQLHTQHREDECLYVLSGTFEFVIESEALAVSEGNSVYIAKGTLHGYENVGERPGRLLVIYTPGGPHERFVEEAEKYPVR